MPDLPGRGVSFAAGSNLVTDCYLEGRASRNACTARLTGLVTLCHLAAGHPA